MKIGGVFVLAVVIWLGASPWGSELTFAGYAVPGVYKPPDDFFPQGYVLIDFDVDASGSPIPDETDIRNQYEDLGVLFRLNGGPASSRLCAYGPGTSHGFDWGDDSISYPNTLASWHIGPGNDGLVVVIDFLDTYFSDGFPEAAGLVFTDSAYNNPFTLKAFDASGLLVDAITINTADTQYNSTDHAEDTFCGVKYSGGISYLEYTTQFMTGGGIMGVEIDNLYYSIPEPATLCLLALGGLVVLRRHRA